MPQPPRLRIRALRVRPVQVPLRIPLVTSSGSIPSAPLALLDLQTEEGVTGHAYLFCYTPLVLRPVCELLAQLGELLKAQCVAPLALQRLLLDRFRLLGSKGVVGMAIAGIDMAAWDALARAQNLPLARLLGADCLSLPAYNSCGLGLIGADRVAAEAETLAAPGFAAIKLRLGYPSLAEDLAAVRAVRRAVGPGLRLMVDYNQVLPPPEAAQRLRALDDEGLEWVEEPCRADDYAAYVQLRRGARTALQMGENWWGTQEMAACLDAGASDLGMPDVMKIGGATGWLRAAALAEVHGLPLSSHLFPEISLQLLAATPTRHWLEYVDWADALLVEPLRLVDGRVQVPERPGSGIEWDEAVVQRLLVA